MKYFYILHDNKEDKDCMVMMSKSDYREVIGQSVEYIIAHNLPPKRFSILCYEVFEDSVEEDAALDEELVKCTEELIEYRSRQNMKTRLMLEEMIHEREKEKENKQ